MEREVSTPVDPWARFLALHGPDGAKYRRHSHPRGNLDMATAWSHAEPKPLRASPTQDPAITVFLADDNLLVREGARACSLSNPISR
jgi:hypothetical protein